MLRYPIYEMFESFQGEGVHMGRRAFFVRLHGCDQHCPWCDSAGTWHPDYTPKTIEQLTSFEIADAAQRSLADFVVVTGGEPALYNLEPLIAAIELPVHLETAGHRLIRGKPAWVTMSPKLFDGAKPVEEENVPLVDEYKFIIESPEDIDRVLKWLDEHKVAPASKPIWLHPEWGHRQDQRVLKSITEAVKHYGLRAGWQIHKMYNADLLDERASKDVVPLGGDKQRGLST